MKAWILGISLSLAACPAVAVQESYAPIVGYNPNDGLILGAAAFLKDQRSYTALEGMGTFNNVYCGFFEYRRDLAPATRLETSHDFSNFFDLYFGEGMNTRLEDKARVDQLRYVGKLNLMMRLAEGLEADPLLEYRWHQESGVNGDPGARLLGDENTVAAGLRTLLDRRDNEFSPSRGYYVESKVLGHPGPRDGTSSFSVVELEGRAFASPLKKLTLAGRIGGGSAFGPASYLYRYSLGDGQRLRGYYGNRFRGARSLSLGGEARFPIWGWFSGDVFVDSGEAADQLQGDLRTTYGGGVRIALPPSGMMKARVDYGRAKDQDGIYVAFGHAF